MKALSPGTIIDGFEIGPRIHSGAMAQIYRVEYAKGPEGHRQQSEFPLIMKIPRMSTQDGSETIVSFEVEQQILPTLGGTFVPRFVASGSLQDTPFLVMEYLQGKTVQEILDSQSTALAPSKIAELGTAISHAIQSLHSQNVCHLDLKPANIMIKPNGTAVLFDFGLSCHAHYPDLLAEEMRKAVGSPAWIAPEQVVGTRGDPRSDLFALGVILYELATRELPFGIPQSDNGLKNRLWMDPKPPRQLNSAVPPWLQEVILRCLEPEAENRYPSAAHIALDLSHPEQIALTARAERVEGTGFKTHFLRWIKAAGKHYVPSPLPASLQILETPIVMVAVPHKDVTPQTLTLLREAARRSLGLRKQARLTCVTVVAPSAASLTDAKKSATSLQRQHLHRLQEWAKPLVSELEPSQHVTYHVLESGDVAEALLLYARSNHVGLLIMGAATHGLKLQNFVSTIPVKVAMHAPCTLILVK